MGIESYQLCTENIRIVKNISDLLSIDLDFLGANEVTFGPQTTFIVCFTQNYPSNS